MKSSNYKLTINDKEYDVKGCPFCGEKPGMTDKQHARIWCENKNCMHMDVYEACLCEDDGRCPVVPNIIEQWNTRA